MNLITEAYMAQAARWPQSGRYILAHYDESSIVVYQAYRPAIGQFAVAHGYFGGSSFSCNRMSWIKPNFLWMMYRSGWGTKEGQEVVLAVWLNAPVSRQSCDKLSTRPSYQKFTGAKRPGKKPFAVHQYGYNGTLTMIQLVRNWQGVLSSWA